MTERKKKMGRPALPKNEKKKVFSLRLSAIEQRHVERAAEKAGKTVSLWARDTLLGAAMPQ